MEYSNFIKKKMKKNFNLTEILYNSFKEIKY